MTCDLFFRDMDGTLVARLEGLHNTADASLEAAFRAGGLVGTPS
jgi:hypothetical protein